MKIKKKYIVTVDIGGTKTNIGYFSNGKLMIVSNFPTKKYGPENIHAIAEILINSNKNISFGEFQVITNSLLQQIG